MIFLVDILWGSRISKGLGRVERGSKGVPDDPARRRVRDFTHPCAGEWCVRARTLRGAGPIAAKRPRIKSGARGLRGPDRDVPVAYEGDRRASGAA